MITASYIRYISAFAICRPAAVVCARVVLTLLCCLLLQAATKRGPLEVAGELEIAAAQEEARLALDASWVAAGQAADALETQRTETIIASERAQADIAHDHQETMAALERTGAADGERAIEAAAATLEHDTPR